MSANPMSQRILIIGSTGQVGRELLAALAPLGSVIATARAPELTRGVTPCRALDVTDLEAVRATVREVSPTVIVNAAAYTAVDRAETETELATIINAIVPGILADEARQLGCALVHYSTDYVFDGSGTRPWRENDTPHPLGAYGRTKLAGEAAVRAAGAAHVILRVSWIYAAHGQNFVKTMLKLAADRTELRVVADQCGAPTPASLVASATAHILKQSALQHGAGSPADAFRERGGTYHVPCAGETNWHEFAEEIFRQARIHNVPLKIERVLPIATADYPTPAQRPHNSRLDGTRAFEQFGLRLPDWRAALAAEFPAIAASFRGGAA
ncbi:MAG TPA: dTDP-4-dehydrorhamnose reductase [Pirellulales bacterium]